MQCRIIFFFFSGRIWPISRRYTMQFREDSGPCTWLYRQPSCIFTRGFLGEVHAAMRYTFLFCLLLRHMSYGKSNCFTQKKASLPCTCRMEAGCQQPCQHKGKGGLLLLVQLPLRHGASRYSLELIHEIAGAGDAALLANRALHAQVERKRKRLCRLHGDAQLAYACAALVAWGIDIVAIGP